MTTRAWAARPGNASLGSWVDLTTSLNVSPPGRGFASMAYDPVDHEVVLFGGRTYSSDYNDTWAYSDGLWVQLHPTVSPPARRGASLTWDPQDGYLVLFGGLNDSTGAAYQDTWTFVGGQWMNRTAAVMNSTNTPPARFVGQMTDDPAGGYVLLFGGCQSVGCFGQWGDTWTYLNGSWTDRSGYVGAAPSARGGEALVWDPEMQAALLYGGDTSNSHLNDTWEFVNGTWFQLSPLENPGHRGDAWAIYDPVQSAVFLFGGLQDVTGEYGVNGPVTDTWRWSDGTWTNVTDDLAGGPSARWAIEDVSTFDGDVGDGLLFGGDSTSGEALADTWELALDSAGPSVTAHASPVNGTAPLTVDFSGNATGGTSPYAYAWSFGDSTPNGSGADVVHQYDSSGVFHATLTVRDATGNQSYANLTIGVIAPLTATLTPSPRVGVAPLEVHWTSVVSGGNPPDSYAWDFGDGTPNASGPTVGLHEYTDPGNYSATLKVTDSQGRTFVAAASVEVVEPLSLSAETASRSEGDAPVAVSFSVTQTGGFGPFTFAWTFGDGGSSSLAAPTHVFTLAGSYNVSVQVIDSLGESSSLSEQIRIAPTLTVSVSASSASIGMGARLYVNASVSGGTGSDSFNWTGLPTGCAVSNVSRWSCVPTAAGNFTVHLTVTDQASVNASGSVTIDVQTPQPSHPTGSAGGLGPIDWLAIAAAVLVIALLAVLLWRRRRGEEVAVAADVQTAVRDSQLPPESVPPPPDRSSPALAAAAGAAMSAPGAVGPPPTLSIAEQILAHIYGLGRLQPDETAPIGFTQEGIAQFLGRPQNVFGKVLTRMEAAGLVVAELRHIQGGGRRRKVYRLTDRGEEAARQVRARVGVRSIGGRS
jgi:PKD repeat protein